jgi:hypothetical protein
VIHSQDVTSNATNSYKHISIVAVHGLGANPNQAWIRKVAEGKVNWLADQNMLPAKIPYARIMTFNYESKWHMDAPKQRRHLCAIQLLTALDNKRREVRVRAVEAEDRADI